MNFTKLILLILTLALLGCEEVPVGDPFWGAIGAGEPIVLVGNVLNGGESVAAYSKEGELLNVLKDYAKYNLDPEGIYAFGPTEILVSLDGIDQIETINIFGETISSINTTFLSGNIYQMTVDNNVAFVIESNGIECFNLETGNRIGNPCIATTVGSCTLSTPRGITVNADGNLVVINNGNDNILVYDVSDPTAVTCNSSNSAASGKNPVGVLAHSNGNLYITTQGDDKVFSLSGDGTGALTEVYGPGTTVLNNPTAIAEMPDGSILVASDGTNDILRISADGTPVSVPFIKSAITGQVNSIFVMGGTE